MPGPNTFRREKIVEVVSAALERATHAQTQVESELGGGVILLKEAIADLHRELDTPDHDMPAARARDDLTGILAVGASANLILLDACENIKILSASGAEGFARSIESELARIQRAVAVHNAAGLRIGRIFKTLREVDSKAVDLLTQLETRLAPPPPAQGVSASDIEDLLDELM